MSFAVQFSILLIFATLFNQNYAAFFKTVDRSNSEKFSEYYLRMKNNNVHRGVLLSKNLEEQKLLCKDILSSQYFQIKQIVLADEDLLQENAESSFARSDELVLKDKLVIKKVVSEGEVIAEEELFLICHGIKKGDEIQLNTLPFYISFAFLTSVFYASKKSSLNQELDMDQYYDGSTSPKNPISDLYDVEELYIKTHQNIDALRSESHRYIEMIEARDDIQALSPGEKITLCASILATKDFQAQDFILDPDWAQGSDEKDIVNNQQLHIWNPKYPKYQISSDNMPCKAFDTVFSKSREFFYTRSYNNKNSVFLIDKHDIALNDGTYHDFDTYFEGIPVLINAKKKSGAV